MPEEPTLQVNLSAAPAINLALLLCGARIVHQIHLKNVSDVPLKEIRCHLSTEPAFTEPVTFSLDFLDAGQETTLGDLEVKLDYAALINLADAMPAKYLLNVEASGVPVASTRLDFTAYSADQFLGFNNYPASLAAFVTPNMDAVAAILNDVRAELKEATGEDAIVGYQKDRERVYETCRAVYRAVHNLGIGYITAPASMGVPGQHIRLVDHICKFRQGCSLDLSLLIASLLEQCGLHPVIFVMQEHAFIGCHLLDTYFSEVPIYYVKNEILALKLGFGACEGATVDLNGHSARITVAPVAQAGV